MPKRKSFASNHHALITVFGAVLILVTFVVRDCSLEAAKDAKDDASSKREILQIRADTFEVELKVKNISIKSLGETAQNFARLLSDDPEKFTDSFTTFFGAVAIDGGAQLSDERHNINDIIDIVGEADPGCTNAIIEKAALYEKQTKAAVGDLFSSILKEHDRKYYFISSYLIEGFKRDQKLCSDILETKQKALIAIRANEEKAARRYNYWKYISYVLFVVGWLFALYGKASGISLPDE